MATDRPSGAAAERALTAARSGLRRYSLVGVEAASRHRNARGCRYSAPAGESA